MRNGITSNTRAFWPFVMADFAFGGLSGLFLALHWWGWASVVLWLGAHRASGIATEPAFAALWYLVILPVEIAAAFALGRAGQDPGRRRAESPSPTPAI